MCGALARDGLGPDQLALQFRCKFLPSVEFPPAKGRKISRVQMQSGRAWFQARPLQTFAFCSLNLELILDRSVPKPSLGISCLLIITVFEGRGHKWRLLVEHVVHTQSNGGVIQPGSPTAWIVLRGGHWHDILILAVLRLSNFSAILGIDGDLGLSSRCREVEGVCQNIFQSDPLAYFPIGKPNNGEAILSVSTGLRHH